jgi:hypothetical protein
VCLTISLLLLPPLYCGFAPLQAGDHSKPTRAQHVSLIEGRDVSGRPIWQLELTIRVPQAYLLRASIDDTVGIEGGYRRLTTASSDQGSWPVKRRADVRGGLPFPCQDALHQLLAHAHIRRLSLERHRAEIKTFIGRTLP